MCHALLFVAMTGLLLGGCGAEDRSPDAGAAARLDLKVALSLGPEFALLGPDPPVRFTIVVSGCRSGAVVEVDERAASLPLLSGDRDCTARLAHLEVGDHLFEPTAPDAPFAVGDVVKLISATAGPRNLLVERQLGSPLGTSDGVMFRLGEAAESPQSIEALAVTVRKKGRILRGLAGTGAPDYAMRKVRLTGVDERIGAFEVQLTFECSRRLRRTTSSRTAACRTARLHRTDYALVPWASLTPPCTSLNTIRCDRLLSAGSLLIDPDRDMILPGASSLANGGFRTPSIPGLALKTPADTAVNSSMLMLLRAGGGYQYFILSLAGSRL